MYIQGLFSKGWSIWRKQEKSTILDNRAELESELNWRFFPDQLFWTRVSTSPVLSNLFTLANRPVRLSNIRSMCRQLIGKKFGIMTDEFQSCLFYEANQIRGCGTTNNLLHILLTILLTSVQIWYMLWYWIKAAPVTLCGLDKKCKQACIFSSSPARGSLCKC